MTDTIVPKHIKQFLLKNIDSVAQWEGLLLLRANPDKTWSAQAVAQGLYIDETEAAQLLARLAARDLLAVEDRPVPQYRYGPKSPDTVHMIDEASDLYRRYLIPMTHLIHSKSRARIQEFADAFKLRKDQS